MISLLIPHIVECVIIYIFLKLQKKEMMYYYPLFILVFLLGIIGFIIYLLGGLVGIIDVPFFDENPNSEYSKAKYNLTRNRDFAKGVEGLVEEKKTAKEVSAGYMWVCSKCNAKYNKYITRCEICGRTKEAQKMIDAGGWECEYCKSGNPQNVYECIECKQINYTIKEKIEKAPYFYGAVSDSSEK